MALTAKRRHTAVPPPPDWAHAETIFAQIPHADQRDRVLFRLMFTCRLKAFEAIRLRREDVVLTDHAVQMTLRDKRGTITRTIQLSDDSLVQAILIDELCAYLRHTGYPTGPVFRHEGREGQPLTLGIVQSRWHWYVAKANSPWTLKQLRAG